ncbi:pentatricopeptide repeat-containing protein At4g39530 [Cynara cardunculus var. scolymus]|uniref:pentatricopeptide repeat-containing protein At4g39530 n=1 Tax=Cynara cardunculus var. scolymus TaxID=59895 RepID=UPI000D62B4D1|nr:pentatricopeptide repeat-containing protein At4g39530 [Cynara cardunculus var. scolymus]
MTKHVRSLYAAILHVKSCNCKAINPQFSKFYKFSTLIPVIINRRSRIQELAKLLQSSSATDKPSAYYKLIHGQIIVSGFQADLFLANILINSYSRCDHLAYARTLFDEMPERNISSWSSMISAYTQHGYNEEAWMVFLMFQRNCEETPNEYVLASVIRTSTQLGSAVRGSQLHSLVVKTGIDQDVYVGTSIVDFYSKIGKVEDARLVFDALPIKNAVTWTTIITGYARVGKSEVSLQLLSQMKQSDVVPDKYVLSSVLSACSVVGFFEGGKQIHGFVLRREAAMDISVSNALVDLYIKCGKVRTGRMIFNRMPVKNVISWTTMISGYMQNSFDREAMNLFIDMTRNGWKPDGFACTSILTSCASLEALEQGIQTHAYTVKTNLDEDEFVNNGLIDMYSKCNCLADARRAFNGIPNRNVIGYNAMIESYSRHGNLYEALDLFREMRLRYVEPSLLTFVSLLGVSASLLTLELSKQIHGFIIKFGVSLDIFAGSALIDVYSKCSFTFDARRVFDEMSEKDIVVWNSMLFGYTQTSENESSLRLYQELQLSCLQPNEFTFVAMITAASNLASLPIGHQFHTQLSKTGLNLDPFVTNALLDMYAKCGSKQEAQNLFDSTVCRDIVCWNSMILTYAQHGDAKESLKVFERMLNEGTQPNYVTFVAVLSACDHMGLVKDGFDHFETMRSFGIEPGIEHYACMVSLLARAGKLYEAKEFIERLPIPPAAVIWRSLLSACRVAGNLEMGKYAAEMAILIDPKDSGSYILLSNIFAAKGMWGEVKKVRKRMECNGAVKEAGRSWIEMNNEVHVFIARDGSHRQTDLIYSVIDNLIDHVRTFVYAQDPCMILLND